MRRLLALSGLVLSSTQLLADPLSSPPPIYLQPPPTIQTPSLAVPATVPSAPAVPTQAHLLHPDRASSLLPPRPGTAPPPLSPEIEALQRGMDQLHIERE